VAYFKFTHTSPSRTFAAADIGARHHSSSGGEKVDYRSTAVMAADQVVVGVLALQGSFREHMAMLQQIPGVLAVEVRTKEELEGVSGLIIPGGESTTMARIAEQWGLIPELQSFAKEGRPIWGTCAGMIFLAARAEGGLQLLCIKNSRLDDVTLVARPWAETRALRALVCLR
jgi:putative intracellular protease/amidase